MTDDDCPISRLLAIGEIVAKTDAGLGTWLVDAVLDHVELGLSLDAGLRLTPGRRGKESARFLYLRRKRNFHLRAALDELGDFASLRREILALDRLSQGVLNATAPPVE